MVCSEFRLDCPCVHTKIANHFPHSHSVIEVTGDRVGLAITQSLTLTTSLQWGVRQGTEVSKQLMSVERVMEYSELDTEKQPDKLEKISQDWPRKGAIEFRKVFYRHFADAEPVLRQLSFTVQPKEKIGRTIKGFHIVSDASKIFYSDFFYFRDCWTHWSRKVIFNWLSFPISFG